MSRIILIVGCGAIGGLFAAALSSVAKVAALDANDEPCRPSARAVCE
jgi:ketopantoate reductase